MDSIEGAYIGLSRYFQNHFNPSSWFPLWYCGIPLQNAYPPLLHLVVALSATSLGVSTALAHHAVTATTYCLGPVALYLSCFTLSRSIGKSLVAGLIFTLWSPSALLMPSVYHDLHSLFLPRRLQTLLAYGDGPHITAITFLFFAVMALHLAMEKRSLARMTLASIAFAAVVSTNWLGAFALALACICYLCARVKNGAKIGVALIKMCSMALIAYFLVAPWIPPSTIAAVRRNSQVIGGLYTLGGTQLQYGVLLLLAFGVTAFVLARSSLNLAPKFSLLFLLLTAGIVLPADWFHIYVVPQPERYHLEMEAAIALLLPCCTGVFLRQLGRRFYLSMCVAIALAGVTQFKQFRRYERRALPPIDIRQTIEYQTSTWLSKNLPHQRVFAEGSVEYWLNAFSDQPQVGGGFAQGITNPQIHVVMFGIPFPAGTGKDAAMVARLFGAGAMVVSEINGRDAYRQAWADPLKLRGALPELWRNGGDVIYGLSQQPYSLAHIIPTAAIVGRPPVNILDLEELRRLDTAVEHSPPAQFEWRGDSAARISGNFNAGEVIYLQLSYHPGWHALIGNKALPIQADGLGMMIVDPSCIGACTVELIYDGGGEMRFTQLARLVAMGFILITLSKATISRLATCYRATNQAP